MSARPAAVLSERPFEIEVPQSKYQSAITTTCIACGDLLAMLVLFGLVVFGRHLITDTYLLSSFFEFIPFVAMILVGFWLHGLYPGVLVHPADEMHRVWITITTVFLMITCATFFWRNGELYSRAVIITAWATATPLVLVSRYLVRNCFGRKSWWGVPAIVFGSGKAAQRIIRILQTGNRGLRVSGVVTEHQITNWQPDMPPILGLMTDAPELAQANFARYAIIVMPEKATRELQELIQDCCTGFSHVLLVPDLPGICSLGVAVRELDGAVALELPQRLFHQGAALTKRITDLVIASLALLILTPVLILVTLTVKLSSRGPLFFAQSRYGRGGRTFKALKFRTMVQNAEQVLADHLASHPEIRSEWERDHKLKKDPRVTVAGKWLRRFSLDELPQIFNVLAGHMSLVGPRPIVEAEIRKYGRGYDLYSRVRPGITGLWQVSGRNNTTYQERVTFDEFYVRNWSVWLDLYILIRTVRTVLTAEGAY